MVMQTDRPCMHEQTAVLEVIQNHDRIFLHLDACVDETQSVLYIDGQRIKERALTLSSGLHTLGYELKNHGGRIVESAETTIDVPILPRLDTLPASFSSIWRRIKILRPEPPFDYQGYVETQDGLMNFSCPEAPEGSRLRVEDSSGIHDHALVNGRCLFQVGKGGANVSLILPDETPLLYWQIVYAASSQEPAVDSIEPILDVSLVSERPVQIPDASSSNPSPSADEPSLSDGQKGAGGVRPSTLVEDKGDRTSNSSDANGGSDSSSKMPGRPDSGTLDVLDSSSIRADSPSAGSLTPAPDLPGSNASNPMDTGSAGSSAYEDSTNSGFASSEPRWDPWNILFAFGQQAGSGNNTAGSSSAANGQSSSNSSQTGGDMAKPFGQSVAYAGFEGSRTSSSLPVWRTVKGASSSASTDSGVSKAVLPSLSKADVSHAKGVLKGSDGRFASGKKIFTRDPQSFEVEVLNGSLERLQVVSLYSKKSYDDLKSALDAETKTAFEVRARILDANSNGRTEKWTLVPLGDDLMNTIDLPGGIVHSFYTLSPDGAIVHTSSIDQQGALLCRGFDAADPAQLQAAEPLRLYIDPSASRIEVFINGKQKQIKAETDELGQSYLPLRAPIRQSEIEVKASERLVYAATLQSRSVLPWILGLPLIGMAAGVCLDVRRRKLR